MCLGCRMRDEPGGLIWRARWRCFALMPAAASVSRLVLGASAFRIMKHQTPAGGRIINNGSVSAHVPRPNSIAYTATKHAVTGLTRAASLDGRDYRIACGQIDIGNAATGMAAQMSRGVAQADGTTRSEPTIAADDLARAVVYMASLPLDANVQFMTVMATGMPYIGRG